MRNVLEVAGNALRGLIVAAPCRKLCVSDLSNIEGRVLAWLAREDWKLEAFKRFDAGDGPDLYKLAYARAFQISPDEVGKDERQIGKVMELALGYGGGVGAFTTMAVTYGLDLAALAVTAWPTIPGDVKAEADKFWHWAVEQKRTLDLPQRVFVVCDSLKRMWRRAHPATVAFWGRLEDMAYAATDGAVMLGEVNAGRLAVDRKGNWLRVRLPSGRFLCYPSPRVAGGKLSFMGVNPYTRKWQRLGTYSGKLAENATQAASRDVLADAMPRVEAAGYPIVLHVHDELVTEPQDTDRNTDAELSAILATPPAWADGLPLAAAGFTTYRYRKA